MKVGVAMNMLYEHGKPDVAVVQEHFQLGDLVEPLGFDSLWALEHHFTGYAMVARADAGCSPISRAAPRASSSARR